MKQLLLKRSTYVFKLFLISILFLSCEKSNVVLPHVAAVPQCKIGASSTSLPFGGGKVTLAWSSKGANFASITPRIGAVGISGDTTIDVKVTTTFILFVSNNSLSVSDSATIKVSTKFEFVYPLAIGNHWTYRYHYSYYAPYESRVINGVHVWSVISVDSLNDQRTYGLLSIRNDTLQSNQFLWEQLDSVSFSIIVSKDSIDGSWTSMMLGTPLGGLGGLGRIPRFPAVPHDTIKIYGVGYAAYIHLIGLDSYWSGFSSITTFVSESLDLTAYNLH
jgi:hypothetical protein